MSKIRRERSERRKRRIERRLRERRWCPQYDPVLKARTLRYEVADKTRGLDCGGIGAVHALVRRVGLVGAINQRLPLLKVHLPYHESDHVLNIAYNVMTGGTCLQDIEWRRNDEVYLDALGAQRIPDPTTAGDFCRRFSEADVRTLMDVLNEARLRIWKQQPQRFFDQATVDFDGSLAETFGECKQGMGLAYDGTWSYHPLIVSLAETGEPIYLMNRSGERPSHEGAAEYADQAGELLKRAGFKQITFRGDTDFSQTKQLDGWNRAGYRFVFGMDAHETLVGMAENLPESAWSALKRTPKHTLKTERRARPENIKEQIVREKEWPNIRSVSEEVAEFDYRPWACQEFYTIVVLKKNLSVEKGEQALFDDVRYFFYITNDRQMTTAEVVEFANGRCNQENLIEQLKNGVNALRMPLGDLVSNWAYMVMASLAWSLKAWFALLLPDTGRWAEKYRVEKLATLSMRFKTFVNAFIRLPCQVIRTGRRIVFRLLSWNPWQHVFLRGLEVLRC